MLTPENYIEHAHNEKKTKIAVLKNPKRSRIIFKIETTKNSVGKVARFTPKTFR